VAFHVLTEKRDNLFMFLLQNPKKSHFVLSV